MNNKTLWFTRTAFFTALLIVVQVATAPLKNTFITGTLVNLLLILAVMLLGLPCGAVVAIISPIFAKLLNIGPLWGLIPFIAMGNLTLVIVWNFAANSKNKNLLIKRLAAVPMGAGAKFLVLYFGIVKFAIPLLLSLPQPQATAVSAVFSIPQLITALIGGGLALVVLPLLENALGHPLSK